MIKPSDIFLIENRFLALRKGSYDMHSGQLNANWIEMLPPLSPVVTITEALTAFEATTEEASAAQSYTIEGSNLYSVLRVVPPVGYEVSRDGTNYLESLQITPSDGALSATIYIRLKANEAGDYNGNIRHSTTGYSENVAIEGSVVQAVTSVKYGFLYNWWATQDQGGGVSIIPSAMSSEGWAVASDTLWYNLENYVDSTINDPNTTGYRGTDCGDKLKSNLLWNGDNSYDFNGRPCGQRSGVNGTFDNKTDALRIWTKRIFSTIFGWFREFTENESRVRREAFNHKWGLSIRTVRTATSAEQLDPDGILPDTYYYGNDGKKYRVTKIGTQVWLADNLAETKWSDGSWIQGYDGGTYTPISDANWAALTTAALCAYDDDESNVLI